MDNLCFSALFTIILSIVNQSLLNIEFTNLLITIQANLNQTCDMIATVIVADRGMTTVAHGNQLVMQWSAQ